MACCHCLLNAREEQGKSAESGTRVQDVGGRYPSDTRVLPYAWKYGPILAQVPSYQIINDCPYTRGSVIWWSVNDADRKGICVQCVAPSWQLLIFGWSQLYSKHLLRIFLLVLATFSSFPKANFEFVKHLNIPRTERNAILHGVTCAII